MSKVSGQKLGVALCEVFHLDPKKVRSITIHAHAECIASVEITQIIQNDELSKIVNILKKYDIEQNDSTPEITGDDGIKTMDEGVDKECYSCYCFKNALLSLSKCYKCQNFSEWKPDEK